MKALEKAAKALLKRRWYDCEPEAWHDLETFYAQIDPDHVFEAYDEARAVISSIEVDGAMVEVACAECDLDWNLRSSMSKHGLRRNMSAALKAFLHSILVDGDGK